MGKLLSHPITLIIFTLVCAVFIFSLRKNSQKTDLARETTDTLQQEVQDLANTVTTLQEKQEYVASDEYKEKLIRNELLMQKEGEYVVTLLLPEETAATSTPPPSKPSPREQWFNLLFE
jgi:cell division protein FtsB